MFVYFKSNFAGFLNRCAAVTVLTAMLVPVFLFQPVYKTSAKTLPVPQTPAVISAPPEAFIISNNSSLSNSITTAFGSFLSFSNKTISRLFEKPKVPAGLEQPENQLSVAENPYAENTNQANLFLTLPPAQTVVKYDFDGDHKADIARWHSSNTEWKVKNSSNGNFTTTTLGSASSIIAPGDFDGDGKTDVAVFNAGTWTIKKSTNNQTITVSFGTSGDKPVVGDYDGDTLADCAVFRPSTNTWWILRSSDANYTSTNFGSAGDITAQGNFDGDAYTDIAVFRPSTGDWHVQGSSAGYFSFHWGVAADIPVPADFDGDGKTDFAVYRGSAGTWYVSKSSTNNSQYFTQVWGNYGDQPLPADYDGDGKDDFAVWRPTNGVWYVIKSGSNPIAYDYQTLGQAGDTAISSAYLKQIGGAVAGYDLAKARLSPKNSTGGTDLYSQNFGWGTSLVGLPGRAGMDMGFGISYNSLIWTKEPEANAIYFDSDNSNVSPGFRFGFPTIEPVYWDKDAERFNYLMVTPSGARVEFRQLNGASDTYETADSSYVQLKTTGASNPNDPVENITIIVSTTDGTNATYLWKAGAFRCSEIKDRNGNYITVVHNEQGLLTSVTDTLGRVVSVNYDTELYPTSITQTWKNNNGQSGDYQYTWASFTYTTTTVSTNFASGLNIVGPANDTALKALQKITYPSGAYTTFEYNGYAQVKKVTNYAADTNPLNYVETNLDNPSTNQPDCPRFSVIRNWVKNFNQDQPVIVTSEIYENATYDLPGSISGTATKIEVSMQNHPHGAVSKTFVGSSGWMEGLTIATEDWANGTSGSEKKRWTWTNWTQDDTNLSNIQNPRVVESRVGDASNIKRTTTEYRTIPLTTIAEYGLVSAVYVYDSDLSTVLKKVETDYNLSSAYLSRRIIGLPSEVRAYGRENSSLNLVSKVGYQYDEGDFTDTNLVQNIPSVIQHDNTNFSSSLITGRGNLTSVTRYDVLGQTASVTSQTKYNTAGAPVSRIDPTGREVKIGYTDNFNDNQNRNTFAYPTTLTDSANHFSEVKYRFDIGANVWAKSPAPAGNSIGKESVREFDSVGRLLKETIVNNGAYTRYEYPTNGVQSKIYSTIVDTGTTVVDVNDEVFSESWTDGAGRVRRSRTEHPGSSGGFKASLVEYNILGQVTRSTVPTEISVSNVNNPDSWAPAGDDNRGVDSNSQPIWLWISKEYDWKGRVTREVNTDGTDRLMSYEGCGCAGWQVTTIQSEVVPRDDQPTVNTRRTQKIYEDILGRTWKTEVMNWDGTSPYTTTVQTFNGRDQITNTRQYSGSTSSSNYQDVTMTYDGHGRMKTRHYPIEDANTYTTWNYNLDDTIHEIIDPRGALTSFTYNNLGLTSQISYSVPSGSTIPVTPTVTFSYDDLGNRTSMTDGTGTTTYAYNDLSQLLSETKQFNDSLPNAPLPNNKFKIEYTYNLSGGLKSITDPYGSVVNYTSDKTGRLTAVAGTAWAQNTTGNYASNIKYRAWGAIKQMDYTPPTDTEQIKLDYDNRLRVSHYEYTSSLQTSGYVMKADFSYLADSRTQAKNDLLNDAWDRMMQYDQAGRLVFNQFGMGPSNSGGTTLVYEQAIQYDGFSQMTSRMVTHWGNDGGGFSATYINGRKQDLTLSFDASGNIVAENHAINEFQNMTFDAAGRRSAYLERWHTNNGPHATFIVWENKTEQIFDGDGRAVIDKRGQRRMNQEVVPPMTTSPYLYHIWSSVLGAVLTDVENTGRKLETKVFAGGTVIAKQTHFYDNGQNYDNISWVSADPVTSTTGGIGYGDNTSGFNIQDYEPLGQAISPHDTSEAPEPTYQTHVNSVDFPEWQCQLPENFLPIDCKMKQEILDSINGTSIKTIYDPEKKPGDPSFVHVDDPPATSEAEARDDHLMHETTHATAKPVNVSNTGAAVQPSQLPNSTGENDNDTIYGDANGTSYVTVRGGPSLPVDFVDASYGGGSKEDPRAKEAKDGVRAILSKKDGTCAKFFEGKGLNVLNSLPKFKTGQITDSEGVSYHVGIETTLKISSADENKKRGYLLVSQIKINLNGPFLVENYTPPGSQGAKSTPKIGGYEPATLGSRMLQILHEIGHLVLVPRGNDGFYYLLDLDGENKDLTKEEAAKLSEKNTEKVLAACKTEIDAYVSEQTNKSK